MAISDVGASPVSVLATDTIARVSPGADLWAIADALVDADVGALAVGDGDDVLGIVSERDVVRAMADGGIRRPRRRWTSPTPGSCGVTSSPRSPRWPRR
jgi:CBS domain-containing protein